MLVCLWFENRVRLRDKQSWLVSRGSSVSSSRRSMKSVFLLLEPWQMKRGLERLAISTGEGPAVGAPCFRLSFRRRHRETDRRHSRSPSSNYPLPVTCPLPPPAALSRCCLCPSPLLSLQLSKKMDADTLEKLDALTAKYANGGSPTAFVNSAAQLVGPVRL